MDTLRQDLRFAVRMLLKSPGFTAVAVLCIALGIGTNTTAFSVVNAILLRPFPYANPESLVFVHQVHQAKEVEFGGYSYADYLDLRTQAGSFSQIAAYSNRTLVFANKGEEPERIQGAAIAADLFPLIGETPALGRNFRPDEDRPGAEPVVLLGHDLWMRQFNGDPAIVGKTVMVNSTAHTVVGVMKPRFSFPEEQEAWVPLAPLVYREPRNDRGYVVMARLKPGVGMERAAVEVQTIGDRLAKVYPDTNDGWGATVRTVRDEFVDEGMRRVVLTILGAVLFILLIACANVANLYLARATTRQREVAVRIAFGATRGRILRQLLTESVLVALLGGALGLLLGHLGIRWMEASIPTEIRLPYWMHFEIDGPVLLYSLAAATLTGLLFGLAPALQALKQDVHGTLKEGGRGAGGSARRNRLRNTLVIAEVALALVLLIVTSLFMRSFFHLQTADPGFDTAKLLGLRIYLPGPRYEDEGPKIRRIEDVVRRLEAIPGIESVGASNLLPLIGGGSGGSLLIQGRPVPRGKEPSVGWTAVTPHFFQTLGLPVLRGRGLTDREGVEMSQVALVNEAFAKRFFPDSEALGKRIRFLEHPKMEWLTIVGIVPDFKHYGVDSRVRAQAYVSYAYEPVRVNGLTVRTLGDPLQVASAVRREVRAADPEMPVYSLGTMEHFRQNGFWEYRFLGGMFLVFGGIALFLAAIGVYGVLSYSVSQRVREIGVRVALGAQKGDVLRLVIGQGVALALTGVGIGLVLALGAARLVESILFGVTPNDPLSFAGIALLLTAVASLASFLPANRAMDVDPLEALRNE